MHPVLRKILLFIVLVFIITTKGVAQITSDFSGSADGWTAPYASAGTINYNATGGNPTGNVSALAFNYIFGATSVPVYFYFHPPGKFLGNRSSYLNGTFSFDLQQSSTGTSTTYAEVIIGNTTDSLFYFPATPFSPPAAPTWTNYQVVLNAGTGFWKTTNSSTGTPATNANISAILTDLRVLDIRGRYRDVTTTGRLDNVNFIQPIIITTQPTSTAVCESATATLTTAASNNASISYRWQKLAASVWNDLINGSGYSNVTTASMSVNTTGNVGAGSYRCRISGTAAADVFTSVATITVNTRPTAPGVTPASTCGTGTVTLSASGGTTGQYRWYTVATGGTAIPSQTNATYTTPSLSASTTYYVAINNSTCEGNRTAVTATINALPNAPITTGNAACGTSTVVLTAAGGTTGQYRWYTVATGGTAIVSQTNATYTTPSISASTTYYAAINNGTCESNRTAVIATINTSPNAPTATGSSSCTTAAMTLTAAGASNGQYRWYTVATGGTAITGETNANYTTPAVATTTTYYVAINNGTCESTRTSVAATIGGGNCKNDPPVIKNETLSTQIEGKVTLDLSQLISDADNNQDLTTLKITVPPASGASASIDSKYNLIIDYKGISFSGTEKLTIQVCDSYGACTQRELSIDVAGDIIVYNAVSPNNDGKNDYFYVRYIDELADTKKNKVSIYGRWGDLVFEVNDYDNVTKVFKGLNNNGNELPSATYFYKIEFTSSHKQVTGYLTLKH